MEFKPKNREWVKSAAIIFLVVLLVLTFFSKTISNRLLTEVATASVGGGTITAKVRGSGTVSANGSHEVKATQTREVGTVLIKVGQEINVGDMLFTLGSGDSEELEAAYETLRDLQQSYRSAAANIPQYNYDQEQHRYSTAETELEAAQDAFDAAKELLEKNTVEGSAAYAASKRIDATQDKLKELDEIYFALEAYLSAKSENEDLQKQLEDPDVTPDAKTLISEKIETNNTVIINQGQILDNNGITEINRTEGKLTELSKNIASEQDKLEQYSTEYNRLVGDLQTDYDYAQSRLDTAQESFANAGFALENAISSGQQQINSASVQLEGIANQIASQQEKIKKLTGEDGEGIVSNVSGIVQSISVTSGDKVVKGDVMCVIEVPDMGHTISFSVTNDQAKRLRIGDSAKVSNFYWGNEIIATLTTMVNDPKSPQTNKLLTFELEGDVSSGDQITVSVGSKSAGYDIVVPNSCIRSDTNGSFVLAIEAKNSPIGNRYIAKRVNVEVVASDDENSAVTGALSNGDFVITTTSAPVKSGDQVRLADSNE